jgi:hypothetical protein
VVVILGALLARAEALAPEQLTLLAGVGIVLVVGASLYFEARRRARAAA